jgi:hypothetical protein
MTAFFMSLAVPGLGQYYAGSTGMAKVFVSVELAIWAGYFYNDTIMVASRQDYYSQAVLHAGVNPQGKGTAYLNAVGAYTSSYDYNARQLQIAFNPVLYYADRAWEWDSPESRRRFKDLRERELDYKNNVKFCIAGIVLNHILSGLNASAIVRKQAEVPSTVTVNVLNGGLGATVTRRY